MSEHRRLDQLGDYRIALFLTGISAAGKSTVAQRVAEALPRSAHVRGDLFRRMIVNGQVHPTAEMPAEADRQLRLRYALAAHTVDTYVEAGFSVVAQDIVLGGYLTDLVSTIRSRPLLLVVLAPDPDTVAERESTRVKNGYDENWTPHALDEMLRHQTPRIGLWLDTSTQTPQETAEEIIARAWTDARVA
jgi:chloramphenicol 3-O-phosphotransferase